MRTQAPTLALLLLTACGSNSPTAPSPTAPAPSAFTGSVTDTVTGAPVVGFSATVAGGRLMVSAPGYVTRETASSAPTVDLIPETGFDLAFYRQFARGALDGPVAQILRRQVVAPNLYIRTVDNAGAVISAAQLDVTEQAARVGAAEFGTTFAAVERGTGTREGVRGWITVTWLDTDIGETCGQSVVGGDLIRLNYKHGRGCSCGTVPTRALTIKHELGHALGFWHTDSTADLMSKAGVAGCDASPSARERHHAAIVYRRPVGNADVDVDPVGGVSSTQRALID